METGKSLGVLFTRVIGLPYEIISEVFEQPDGNFVLNKPRFLEAKAIAGDNKKANIKFSTALNPFHHKDFDHIPLDKSHKLFFTPPSEEMVGHYQKSINPSPIIMASPSIDLRPVP